MGFFLLFDKKHVLVKDWSPGCKKSITDIQSLLVWVRFPNLDSRYWKSQHLSCMASVLGTPLSHLRDCIFLSPMSQGYFAFKFGWLQGFAPNSLLYL